MKTPVSYLCALLLVVSCSVPAGGCTILGGPTREAKVLASLQSRQPTDRREALLRLRASDVTPAVRAAVLRVLSTDVDSVARALAADALARLGERAGVDELRLSARRDAAWPVRKRALEALAALLGPDAEEDIEHSLAKDPNPTVRVAAVKLAARNLAPQRAASVILAGLKDTQTVVVLAAHRWLREIVGAVDIAPEDYDAWEQAVETRTGFRDLRRR